MTGRCVALWRLCGIRDNSTDSISMRVMGGFLGQTAVSGKSRYLVVGKEVLLSFK